MVFNFDYGVGPTSFYCSFHRWVPTIVSEQCSLLFQSVDGVGMTMFMARASRYDYIILNYLLNNKIIK